MTRQEKRKSLDSFTQIYLPLYYKYRQHARKAWAAGQYRDASEYRLIAESYMDMILLAVGMHKYDGDALKADKYALDMRDDDIYRDYDAVI